MAESMSGKGSGVGLESGESGLGAQCQCGDWDEKHRFCPNSNSRRFAVVMLEQSAETFATGVVAQRIVRLFCTVYDRIPKIK